jgi:aspartyl-tRNA synthetase
LRGRSFSGGEISSSFAKFLTREELTAILERAGAKDGDLILAVADEKEALVSQSLGALRVECARRLGLIREGEFKFLWVTEFPMFEWSEEEGGSSPRTIRSLADGRGSRAAGYRPRRLPLQAYDMVINGYEVLPVPSASSTPSCRQDV